MKHIPIAATLTFLPAAAMAECVTVYDDYGYPTVTCTLDGTDTLPSELQSQYKLEALERRVQELEALERRVQELEALERRVQSLETWALKDSIIEGGPVSSVVFE